MNTNPSPDPPTQPLPSGASAPPPPVPSVPVARRALSTGRKTQAGVAFALVCLGVAGTESYLSVDRLRTAATWSRHTEEVIASVRLLLSHVTDAETSQRGYAITDDDTYLQPYAGARLAIAAELRSLRLLTADNPAQQPRLDALEPLIAQRLGHLEAMIDLQRRDGFAAVKATIVAGAGKELQARIRTLTGEIEAAERLLLRQRDAAVARSETRARLIAFGGSVLALGLGAVALFAVRRDFARRHAQAARDALAVRLSRMGAWSVALPSLAETWSDQVRAIHELPPGAVLTSDAATRCYAPEFRETITRAVRACARDGTPFDLELQIVTAGGRRVWVRSIGEAQRDARGVIQGIHGVLQDITERTLAVATLQRQQADLRVLFDLMPAMIWFKDTQDRILRVNRRAADLAGKSVAEIEGRPASETYPADASRFYADDLEVIHSGSPKLGAVAHLLDRGGREIWVQTDKVPVCDQAGNVVGIVVMAQDITERKRADENVQRLAALVEYSADAIISKSLDGLIMSWNPAAETMFGYPAAEIVGQPLRLLIPADHATEEPDILAGYARGNLVHQFETIRLRHDGRRFDVSATISPIKDRAGRIVGISSIIRDITERKQATEALRESETRFRELAENIDEVFWIADPAETRKLYISPAFEKIWGRTCQSAYDSPLLWLDAIRPEDRDRVRLATQSRPTRGAYQEEYRIVRPDGKERWIRDRAFPVRDPAGAIKRWVGIAEDITDYRTMEEQLRQTQKMEAIGTLAGGIAHDFNNILAAIGGYTELALLTLQDNPAVRDNLEAVLQASSRAADLVRQILTFSRQQRVERRPLQLRPVVDETLHLLRATIPSTIEFDISLAPDAPTVFADATQIHQILMNLGTNAWHAMKDRAGKLQISLERCPVDAAHAAAQSHLSPGLYARISISDTGCGMEAETQRRIFEPFFTTKPAGEGTGLGLAVVHGIMESYGGAVTVYSQLGEGTVFHLYFPAYAGDAIALANDEGPTPLGHGERLLFVDDEPLLAQLGRKTLAAIGYEVESTTLPATALAMVRADPSRFALVLTDQTMPGMTGLSLASELHNIRPGLPVILMTGYSLSLTPARVDALGIRQLLIKPIGIHSLAHAVHAALSPVAALPPPPESARGTWPPLPVGENLGAR